jgi:SagB-type dehydrogenase family enzyme
MAAPGRPAAQPPPPACHERYRLRADATLACPDDGSILLRQSRFAVTLQRLTVGRRSLLLRLSEDWVGDTELSQLVVGLEGEGRLLPAQLLIRMLLAQSWLARRLQQGDRPLLDVRPLGLGAGSMPPPRRHHEQTTYHLSRFAVLRSDGAGLVAQVPGGPVELAWPEPAIGAALTLAAGAGLDRAAVSVIAAVAPATAGRLLDELLTAGVLVPAEVAQDERSGPARAVWSPEELWLHDRSRPGRHVLPVGGTYRFRGRLAPEPLARDFPGRPSRPLPVPDLELAAKRDPSLTDAIGRRRSLRDHDAEHPITLDDLAEFLYRVQRLEPLGEPDPSGQQLGRRPYPCGGGVCELEVYPVVAHCAGLPPGLYHYDSLRHRLELLADRGPTLDKILGYARAAGAMPAVPQVDLVITARVGRLLWKYEGMGYSMILKHAGVLTELMYLVATAMGLAPCALGAGDAAAFAAAAGLDPLVEPSVADFALGSRAAPPEAGTDSAAVGAP